ncbi:MAG: ABC transporter permease [Holosporales bacterium]|nr:ABC transporter permease [Holosporales bacterium]
MSVHPTFDVVQKNQKTTLKIAGSWQAKDLKYLVKTFNTKNYPVTNEITLDCKDLKVLDTSGAWLLNRFLKGYACLYLVNVTPQTKALLQQVNNYDIPSSQEAEKSPDQLSYLLNFLAQLGHKTVSFSKIFLQSLSFFGEICSRSKTFICKPWRFRGVSLFHFLYEDGVKAVPIVGLISFLIGIVLVYQGADQLRRFGAEIFTVDLLAISALREIGILLTAIVVAGRSGSAFTAQIGFMKLNQEIDAMVVLGLNPVEILVLPRILALVIILPLLAFFADMMALMGGALMTSFMLDLNLDDFLHQLRLSIKPWTFWTGIIKAPVFAFFIALIGCFEGLQVHGGAQSVGMHTTKSVVQSIFLVVVLDAFFSILFSILGI